jgi:hypothetical protein
VCCNTCMDKDERAADAAAAVVGALGCRIK